MKRRLAAVAAAFVFAVSPTTVIAEPLGENHISPDAVSISSPLSERINHAEQAVEDDQVPSRDVQEPAEARFEGSGVAGGSHFGDISLFPAPDEGRDGTLVASAMEETQVDGDYVIRGDDVACDLQLLLAAF